MYCLFSVFVLSNYFPGIVSNESASRSSCSSSNGASNSRKKTTYIRSRVLHQNSQGSSETLFARVFTRLLHWRGRVRGIFAFSQEVAGGHFRNRGHICSRNQSSANYGNLFSCCGESKRKQTNKQARKVTGNQVRYQANKGQIMTIKQDYETGVSCKGSVGALSFFFFLVFIIIINDIYPGGSTHSRVVFR